MNQIIDVSWLEGIIKNTLSFFCGLFMSAISFLLPVKNVVHLVLFLFLLDVLFGYWRARKMEGQKFQVKIIWNHTMPRIMLSLVIILSSFMLDQVYKNEIVSIHRLIGFFISGVLLYSISVNGYKITKWMPFRQISNMVNQEIINKTGEKIE